MANKSGLRMPHVEEISTGRLPCDFHLLRSVPLRGSIVKYLLGQWKDWGPNPGSAISLE